MTTRSFPTLRRLVSLTPALLLFAACQRNEVESYRVAKEKDVALPVTVPTTTPDSAAAPAGMPPAMAAAGGGMAGTPVATAAGPGLTWTAPASWQATPGSAMRKGSYAIGGGGGATADLSITAFPGAVGGELANVNRWRGQLSLPPIAESDLATAVTRSTQNGLAIALVDLVGTDAAPQRMLGAMVPYEGGVWFFKLLGPDALVAKEKPAFVEFLKTVKPATP